MSSTSEAKHRLMYTSDGVRWAPPSADEPGTGGTMDVNVKVKVTPFVTNGEREGFEGYYVWNSHAESDLFGLVTRTPASEKWSHSRTNVGEFDTKEEAIEALTNQVQFERLASYAETLLRLETFGITDSWREDD